MRLLIMNHAKKYKKDNFSEKPTIFDKLSLNKNCEKDHNLSSLKKKTSNAKIENFDKIAIKKILFKKDNNISRNKPIMGKLFNFINTSINKKSLGCIPTNTENILLTSKISTNRFEGPDSIYSKINQYTPGVGDYNVFTDTKVNNTLLDLSDEDRFNHINTNPGVGDYDLEKGEEIFNSRNNFRYSNLYNKTRKLFINNIENTNNNSINKTINNTINNSMSVEKYYSLCPSPRNKNKKINNNINFKERKIYPYSCKKDIIRKLPEIQKKFIENRININNNKTINALNDYFYRKNHHKYRRIFNTIDNNENENNTINISLKHKFNKDENKVYTFEDIYKMYKSENKRYDKREELEKKLNENKNFNYSKKLKFSIKQDRELEKIKTILGNDNGRKDLFNLSPSRWKKNKYELKVPGPAYYFHS